jgi:hypothetical protein
VWTPKRVLVWLGGFALFFCAYVIYSGFLGGIDGLTPLPEAYWPPTNPEAIPELPVPTASLADRKLQQAFGEACPELQRTIKLEQRARGIVIAVDVFQPVDGRVMMKPFSCAVFGKAHGEGGMPEINTIQSDVAYLDFDRKITNISQMNNAKITGGELTGDITITNNRRTAMRDDDLHMHTKGTIFYHEASHHIYTREDVELTDFQSKPEPIKVTATGMDLYLTAEPATPPPGGRKKTDSTINGVDRIELRSTVRMDLFVDSQSGFLAPNKPPSKPAAAAKDAAPPPKSKVIITTPGRFVYDVHSDRASFQIQGRESRYPEKVEVKRLHEQGKMDQLQCDQLDLQFRRKADAARPAPAADDRQVNLEIESAHATGRDVTLTSDAEGLNAFGNDLFYNAIKRQTILKGTPEMVAMKDGNEIYSRELQLTSNEKRDAQEAVARGPGRIRMLDRTNGQRNLEAHWTEQLLYQKEGGLDCLTLTGDAAFEDKENHQEMHAQRLKVWLEPAAPGTHSDDQQQRLRPHRVEAKGRVRASSPELKVLEPTEDLAIWFKDAPGIAGAQPPPPQPDPFDQKPAAPGTLVSGQPAKQAPARVIGSPQQGEAAPGTPEKPKKPIELSARSVVVHVIRNAGKNELDQLSCDGTVHVHQDPASADDRGMDIQGDTMLLNHSPEGGILVVNGNMAQVQFDKLALMGPEVNIDQRANKAWVNGIGAMQMITDTNLDGGKLAKPTELTIHWKEAMLFNGKDAEFRGGVQAEQLSSRLLCQWMQVVFDKPISLKEQDRSPQRARIDHLVCDKNVQVEDITRENGKLVAYRRLVAPDLAMDNEVGTVHASGPGQVRMLQMGEAGNGLPGPPSQGRAAQGGAAPKQEMKLTHIRFRGRMQANNKARTAVFFDDVQLVYLPSDNPNLTIDLNHLPPDCFYMRCEKLNVYEHLSADGKTKTQEMIAQHKVSVEGQDFSGSAEVVKYDGAQDRIIFEAEEGGLAVLTRQRAPGARPDRLSGKKIIYWRKTGESRVEDGHGISISN